MFNQQLLNMTSIYDFYGDPSHDFEVWLSKTNNQLSLESQACYLIFQPEIMKGVAGHDMPWSLLELHLYLLCQMLRNHAKADLAQTVRKQLEKPLYESLLQVSPTSLDREIEKLSVETSLNIFRQYGIEHKVRIPFRPSPDVLEMEIHWGSAAPIISEPTREPFGNRNIPVIADVCLKFLDVSYISG